jgi:phospholipase/carboxylesterase
MLDCLEHTPGTAPDSTVIWLHGLGASGYDFAPLVPHLDLPTTRFVFPHAPELPVTLNGGHRMPAWYDIRSLEPGPDRESADDIRRTHAAILALLDRENDRGVPTERIVLAGFSQGAAMTLFSGPRIDRPLAGMMALSGYLVVPAAHETEQTDANRRTPLLAMHGEHDPTVAIARGRDAFERLREGRDATWRTYPMGHEVNGPQIRDLRAWLHARLA